MNLRFICFGHSFEFVLRVLKLKPNVGQLGAVVSGLDGQVLGGHILSKLRNSFFHFFTTVL
jgi:hypothetical protein